MPNPIIAAMGDARVFIDGQDIGSTHGGVKLKDSPQVHYIEEDGVGKTEAYYGHPNITAEFNLIKIDVTTLSGLLPKAALDANGNIVRGSESGGEVEKKEITLKPIVDGEPTDDVKQHWILYEAGRWTDLDLNFKIGEGRVFKVQVEVFYSKTKSGYYQIGNSTTP